MANPRDRKPDDGSASEWSPKSSHIIAERFWSARRMTPMLVIMGAVTVLVSIMLLKFGEIDNRLGSFEAGFDNRLRIFEAGNEVRLEQIRSEIKYGFQEILRSTNQVSDELESEELWLKIGEYDTITETWSGTNIERYIFIIRTDTYVKEELKDPMSLKSIIEKETVQIEIGVPSLNVRERPSGEGESLHKRITQLFVGQKVFIDDIDVIGNWIWVRIADGEG